MEKVTYVWKIRLSWPWTFNYDSCRLRVISHLYWWSNSQVSVNVWLSLDKSIGEFTTVYKKYVLWYGLGSLKVNVVPVLTWLQLAVVAIPHLVKPGCAKQIDLSLGSQAVNTEIFAAALMVGMSFVRTLLLGMKKTLTMMMILMASFNFLRIVFQIGLPSFG